MAAKGILGCVDIIVVSDHGMASVPMNRNVVKLEEMVKDVASSAFCYDCAEGLTPTLRPINDSKSNFAKFACPVQIPTFSIRDFVQWKEIESLPISSAATIKYAFTINGIFHDVITMPTAQGFPVCSST